MLAKATPNSPQTSRITPGLSQRNSFCGEGACSRRAAQRPQNLQRAEHFAPAAQSNGSKLPRHRGFASASGLSYRFLMIQRPLNQQMHPIRHPAQRQGDRPTRPLHIVGQIRRDGTDVQQVFGAPNPSYGQAFKQKPPVEDSQIGTCRFCVRALTPAVTVLALSPAG